MKPQSIPLYELIVADQGSVPKLSASDIYRLLATKVLRGRFISGALFGASLAGLIFTITVFPSIPWEVASGLGCALFGFAFYHARRKLELARRISREPGLVYWAHPTLLRQQVGGRTIDTTFITLHSRSGAAFEVGMSREEMLSVVNWLQQHNPEIRLGPYDGQDRASK